MKFVFFFLFLLGFGSSIVSGQNIKSIRHTLDSAYSSSPFFGNVIVAKNGKILLEKSYGCADFIHKKSLTNKNSFQVASISKQFTAYGIMILKNQGLLHYDSLVNIYLEDFPYNTITVRQLLTHTSGLPDFWNGIRPFLDTSKSNGNKEVLEYLKLHNLPLQFQPGTKFAYSDIGYDFLANIIESVSGRSYQEFMRMNIFEPLEMNDTYAYMITDIRRINNVNLAIGHTYKNHEFEYAHLNPKNNFVYYLGDFFGDGSVVTTARDLLKWDKALKGCKLLPCDVQKVSYESAKFNDEIIRVFKNNPGLGYGFGWFIKTIPDDRMVYHTGGHPGNIHGFYRLVDKNITFIFLSNSETQDIVKLRNKILTLLK